MKYLLTLTSFIVATAISFAQPKDHPHYEKHYASSVEVIETDEVKIEIVRPHSQESHTQFNAKIYNKTDDYILIKRHETVFKSNESGYGEKRPAEATMFIEPKGDITRQFKVEGGPGYKVDKIEVTLGGFSRAPVNGEPAGAGEFKMKPDKNSVMMGPFAVTLKRWRYNSKEITADFKIRYRGEGIGLVNESKINIRKENDSIVANTEAKSTPFILTPMKTRTATVVKRFGKGEIGKSESVYVVMSDALTESTGTEFKVPGFSLSYDEGKTKKNNK
ncbi:hypothetical protein OAE48_03420 [Flavobacteriales bacterium]|nr:hypothetical protein [Flavobacteriales bacterium]